MITRFLHIVLVVVIYGVTSAQVVDADTLKTFTKEAESAYSVKKIEPLIVRKTNGENLGELLQYMTPNFIKRNGPGGIASISVRGGSAWQTQIFWEGIAMNSPTLGQTDLSLLPSEFFTHIRINHSGASSQLGMGGIAGSVSLNSRGQYSQGGSVFFEKEIGSFGLNHTNAKVILAKNSRVFSETVLLKKEALNNFQFHDYSQLGRPKVDRENGAILQLGFQENLQIKTKLGWLKWITNYVDTERGIPAAIGVHEQLQSQTDKNLRTTLQLKTSKAVQKDGMPYRTFSHNFSLGFIKDYQQYRNKVASLKATFNNSTYSAQFHSRYELKKGFALNTQINEYFYRADSDGFDDLVYQNRLSTTLIGSKKWDRGLVSITVQELLIDNKFSPLISSVGGYFDFYTGKYGHQLFGNASSNYRYPSLNDLYWGVGGNKNLLPESSLNFEGGIRSIGNYTNQFFEYGITYFQDKVKNWIQWIPNSSGIWYPENVKSVHKFGLEGVASFRFKMKNSRYFLLTSSYRFVSAEVKESLVNESEVGNQLIYTPNHILNIDGALQLKNISIRYYQTVTSKFYLDRENTTYLPYSAPGNLSVEYSIKESQNDNDSWLSIGFNVHNIWGEEYQIVANQPMPGRWFSFKLTYNLHNNYFGSTK